MSISNDRKVTITLTLPPESKKWLKEHKWVNASALLDTAIQKLKAQIEGNDYFEPLR